jgi:hypothetical protein
MILSSTLPSLLLPGFLVDSVDYQIVIHIHGDSAQIWEDLHRQATLVGWDGSAPNNVFSLCDYYLVD